MTKMLMVADMNARGKATRIHQMQDEDGDWVEVELGNKPVEVPEFIARKFAAIDGGKPFKVMDGDQVIRPDVAKGADGATVLQQGQCIAYYDELNMAALLERANRIAGGENLRQSSGKQAVIDFLNNYRPMDPPVLDAEPAKETGPAQVAKGAQTGDAVNNPKGEKLDGGAALQALGNATVIE